MFPGVWHANTQIQIHKYTNTVWVKFADRPNMCYIFEKVMIRGPQKQCSQVSDIQIHKYKYTNIQIHKYTNTQIYKYTNTVWVKLSDRPNMWYIFQNAMIRGPQKQCSQVSDIQIHKYRYTNTQIQFGSNLNFPTDRINPMPKQTMSIKNENRLQIKIG